MVDAEGANFKLAPWDWRHYAEKLRKQRYDFDQATLKPYLQLDRMIAAMFATAASPSPSATTLRATRPRCGCGR